MARILAMPTWFELSSGHKQYSGAIVECDCGKHVSCNAMSGNPCAWCGTKYDTHGRQEFTRYSEVPSEDVSILG